MLTFLHMEFEDPDGQRKLRWFGPLLVAESYRSMVFVLLVNREALGDAEEEILKVADAFPDRLIFICNWVPSPSVLAAVESRNIEVGLRLEARGEIPPHQRPELS